MAPSGLVSVNVMNPDNSHLKKISVVDLVRNIHTSQNAILENCIYYYKPETLILKLNVTPAALLPLSSFFIIAYLTLVLVVRTHCPDNIRSTHCC